MRRMRGLSRRHRFLSAAIVAACAAATFGVVGAVAVDGNPVQHGLSVTKGCTSPLKIGEPYTCSFTIRNVLDEAHDTMTVSGLVDTVHAAGGDVSSGDLFSSLKLVFVQDTAIAPPTCIGGTGAGTAANPYTSATQCTLPFGSRLNVLSTALYTVQAADYALPNHILKDDVAVSRQDLCDDPAATHNINCNPSPPPAAASSQALLLQLESATATVIHDAGHNVVTAVPFGSFVHDRVTVTGQPGKPAPSGNATFDWFENFDCTGTPKATSGNVTLNGNGQADGTSFPQLPAAPGLYSFKAHYKGDATYSPSDGACEPLRVADARITISQSGTNAVGQPHTFTVFVEKNDGSGWVPANGE